MDTLLNGISTMFLCVCYYSDLSPVPEPCLDSFVFLRVKERQDNIMVEPETDDQRFSLPVLNVVWSLLSLLGGARGKCSHMALF